MDPYNSKVAKCPKRVECLRLSCETESPPGMDLDQTVATLLSKNRQLLQENAQLKSMLSAASESRDLRARKCSVNNGTPEESAGGQPPSLWQNTFDEKQFRKELSQAKHEQRASSPVDFQSFIQSSMHTDTQAEKTESQSCEADVPLEVKDRLLGEIAYQLDRRILSHIFQGHKRHYGFTLLNIPEKIIEVSTHPLTGKVDEGYRLHLTQRYANLMETLNQLGYKTALHPPFCEFIVNTYGILKERPGKYNTQELDLNNPDLLSKLIMAAAPRKLQTDLLLVLTCLCNMSMIDRKPLFLW